MKCKQCGKTVSEGKKYCSRNCFLESRKKTVKEVKKEEHKQTSSEPKYQVKPTQEWKNMSARGVCIRCGRKLDTWWISAYCHACENNYEYTVRKPKS